MAVIELIRADSGVIHLHVAGRVLCRCVRAWEINDPSHSALVYIAILIKGHRKKIEN